MKLIGTILLLGLFTTLSCVAEPPAHKPAPQFVILTAPLGTPPVTGGAIYKAQHADTNWTAYVRYVGTNGQSVTVPFDANPAELYTVDSTNALTGGPSSDYGAVWTNSIPASPAGLGTK